MASLRRPTNKKGISFTLMVVGESGLGKSTLVQTLFGGAGVVVDNEKTKDFTLTSYDLDESGLKIQMNVVDTPGFGDSIDNSAWFQRIQSYLELQYEHFLEEESRIKRNPKFQDTRVFVLLYFISPTGHSLKEIDIQLMKRLCKTVNIIPLIAKADSLTQEELSKFKVKILDDIKRHDIDIFSFPSDPEIDDEDTISRNKELSAKIPFAVIGADELAFVGGKKIPGRRYPWGFVEVENPSHSDYEMLRSVLLGTHMHELKDTTHEILYENWRTAKLENDEAKTDIPHKEFEAHAMEREVTNKKMEEIEKKVLELAIKERQLAELEKNLSTNDMISVRSGASTPRTEN